MYHATPPPACVCTSFYQLQPLSNGSCIMRPLLPRVYVPAFTSFNPCPTGHVSCDPSSRVCMYQLLPASTPVPWVMYHATPPPACVCTSFYQLQPLSHGSCIMRPLLPRVYVPAFTSFNPCPMGHVSCDPSSRVCMYQLLPASTPVPRVMYHATPPPACVCTSFYQLQPLSHGSCIMRPLLPHVYVPAFTSFNPCPTGHVSCDPSSRVCMYQLLPASTPVPRVMYNATPPPRVYVPAFTSFNPCPTGHVYSAPAPSCVCTSIYYLQPATHGSCI